LRRNIDVGRMSVIDDVSIGSSIVRKKVNGERVRELLPATFFAGGGVCLSTLLESNTIS
jgi:hypothetical protein